jgi:1-acyl-sn-glycerol-3-phosphate acyltransferase
MGDAPLVVVLNHPSWWDPMVCIVLSREFGPAREHYPAIDSEALAKYAFFRRLGFFGVDTHSVRGAAEFLRTATALLAKPNRTVWVTAQGQFADVRTRPLGLRSGVGHLAARMDWGFVLPLAVEYTFWTERTPEALLRFGPPIDVTEAPGRSGRDWTARIEDALTDTLDGLNAEAMTRDPDRFMTLLGGQAGVGGVYDLWRRVKALAAGQRFVAEHGSRP